MRLFVTIACLLLGSACAYSEEELAEVQACFDESLDTCQAVGEELSAACLAIDGQCFVSCELDVPGDPTVYKDCVPGADGR